jgi:hypothetical protein
MKSCGLPPPRSSKYFTSVSSATPEPPRSARSPKPGISSRSCRLKTRSYARARYPSSARRSATFTWQEREPFQRVRLSPEPKNSRRPLPLLIVIVILLLILVFVFWSQPPFRPSPRTSRQVWMRRGRAETTVLPSPLAPVPSLPESPRKRPSGDPSSPSSSPRLGSPWKRG